MKAPLLMLILVVIISACSNQNEWQKTSKKNTKIHIDGNKGILGTKALCIENKTKKSINFLDNVRL